MLLGILSQAYPFLNGLGEMKDAIIADWIGPAFIIVVAVTAFIFLKNQQIRELIIFLLIAAVVAVLVFAGDLLFGSDGVLKKGVEEVVNAVNAGNMIPLFPRITPLL